jgi:uncharacterized protein YndB with AHSA1/START domain
MDAPTRHEDLEMNGSAEVVISAPAEVLYDMVSDVTRMGEWSPHTFAARWLDDTTGPAVGARFAGDNRGDNDTWTLAATVTAAERPAVFAFVTGKAEGPATRWEYRFEPVDGGTRVVESFSWTWMPSAGGFRARVGREPIDVARVSVEERREYLIDSMRTTLANLKAAVER